MTVRPTIDRGERRRLNLTTRLAELETFVAEHGRLPRRADLGGLAEWMYAQLKSRATDPEYVHVREEVEKIRSEVLASGKAADARRHCAERLQAVESFVAEHGRLPTNKRTGDAAERGLAGWMHGVNSPDRVGEAYDRARSEVQRLRRDHSSWTKNLAALNDFAAAHGRLPTFAESPTAIRFLHRNTAMLRAGKLSPERATAIESLAAMQPTTARPAEWETAFSDVAAWVEAHGHLPRRRSADHEELRLANWLNRNRQNQRAGRLSATQAKRIAGLESLRQAVGGPPGS